jgi:hypothetical protein
MLEYIERITGVRRRSSVVHIYVCDTAADDVKYGVSKGMMTSWPPTVLRVIFPQPAVGIHD